MKINDIKRIGGINPYQKQNEWRTEGTSKARRKDQVQISPAAKEMLSTSKMTSAERAERVHELKQSVTSGTYHVESGKIAEKLLPYLKE
ncbi:flagellar biosynthesis anti-sigma factor FlgM [Paenibacillus sp. J5C_2022]|uniref:flagellar biosynthesis anti-sigma factor FlgM n=1 Tax=Paenibacillus sp. J5C2022 TaxID=2977129 RepID=UPI0021D0B014|nr:flagellar biosynthesis anti-sigma factor FlgM [Paenibacillus sp. J5C2022]MCU6708446.1 flagellar biosynthesis anti-sigma factor FlgM [Paenibacillus sp. J5C2022]